MNGVRMSENDSIIDALRRSDTALSLGDLERELPGFARRTLQYRLAQLVAQGRVVGEGAGRWRRYSAGSIQVPSVAPVSVDTNLVTPTALRAVEEVADSSEGAQPFQGIPLAPDAQEVLQLVIRPLSERTPVGYQRDWVESYRPGVTWYLSQADRMRLSAMGATDAAGLPAGTYGRSVLERLLIDLSWASSHLEGNTYSRLDTRELILHGNIATGRDLAETQMILNHKRAIETLLDGPDMLELSVFTVRGIHGILSENLMSDPADEGRIRQRSVFIGGSVYRPLDVPDLIESSLTQVLAMANAIPDAFERSLFLLVHLPYLQPFADVNKRTARLVANIPLLQQNLCPLTFVDVPPHEYALAVLGVYELARVELLRDLYLWAYERSTREYSAVQRSLVQPDPLRTRHRETLHELVRHVVRNLHLDPLDCIAEFSERATAPDEREPLRGLMLAELRGLHEGTISRYGLRLSEWRRWVERHTSN